MTPSTPQQDTAPAPILFAHYGNNWIRGSEQCLLDLVKFIDRTRFTPVVLCNWPIVAQAAEALGATAIVHPAVAPSPVIASRKRVSALRAVALEHGIRLMHVNSSLLTPSLLPVARSLRIPLLTHLHIVPTAGERRHELLHQTSLVVGVSRTSVQGFAAEGMSPSRIRIIYNGVDGGRISNGDATTLRRELRIPDTAVTIGTLSSLIYRKGVDVVIGALALLRARGADVHLIVVGDGEQFMALREQATAAGVADAAHFIGERRDAGAVVRDAIDIGVSASREEAFPLNVLEVGYFAKPIVVSDIPPHWEGVEQGVTGVIVAENTPAAFADAIGRLVADAGVRDVMGRAASARVARDFTVEGNVKQFEDTYTELLSRPARTYGWIGGSRWPTDYNRWVGEMVRKRVRVR
jgi:glycosyltransferase involved in cell wall biosynthesis